MRHTVSFVVIRTEREGAYLEYHMSVPCQISFIRQDGSVMLTPEEGTVPPAWFQREACQPGGQLDRMIRKLVEEGDSSPIALLLVCEIEGPLPPYGLKIAAILDQQHAVPCWAYNEKPPSTR